MDGAAAADLSPSLYGVCEEWDVLGCGLVGDGGWESDLW